MTEEELAPANSEAMPLASLSDDEIISHVTEMLYRAVSLFEDENEALRDIVQKLVRLSGYQLDDPYDDEHDREAELTEALHGIRDDIKRGDVEHALLLIHYELG